MNNGTRMVISDKDKNGLLWIFASKKVLYGRRDVQSKRKIEIDWWMDIPCYLLQYIHMVPNNKCNKKLQFFDLAILFSRSIRVNFVEPALTTFLQRPPKFTYKWSDRPTALPSDRPGHKEVTHLKNGIKHTSTCCDVVLRKIISYWNEN